MNNEFTKSLAQREAIQREEANDTLVKLANSIGQQRASQLYDDITQTGLKVFDAIVQRHMEEAMFSGISDIQEAMVEVYKTQDISRKKQLANYILTTQKTNQVNNKRTIEPITLDVPSLDEVLNDELQKEGGMRMENVSPLEMLASTKDDVLPDPDFDD